MEMCIVIDNKGNSLEELEKLYIVQLTLCIIKRVSKTIPEAQNLQGRKSNNIRRC